MKKLELSVASVTTNLTKVENFIEHLIGEFQVSTSLCGKLTTSTIEAVNNAILHGNNNNPDKLIRLTALQDEQKIIVTVEDEGDGFDFKHIMDPTTSENLMKTSGRGLFLMSKLTDEILFIRNGSKVVMTFLLNP